jgi:hypothetical protein
VQSRECLKDLIPAIGYRSLPEKLWWHSTCECHLSAHWISCDALLDKALYEGLKGREIIDEQRIPRIDWDGENDLNIMDYWEMEDIGTFETLDDIFNKVQKEVLPPKVVTAIMFPIFNWYTNRFRKRKEDLLYQ